MGPFLRQCYSLTPPSTRVSACDTLPPTQGGEPYELHGLSAFLVRCCVGAIPNLRLRNLENISELGIYKITVYENTNYEYFTYCTFECAKAVNEYLKMREQYGEKLSPNSFLIREQLDVRDPLLYQDADK